MNKILVIDRDEALRTALAATLQQQGFEVLQATTGVEGIQIARTASPNLILCDVDLQGVGGSLILFAVRRDPKLASIPFVLMSKFAVTEDAPDGIEKGADGFLSKPVTPTALATAIDVCLNKRAEMIVQVEAGSISAPSEAGSGPWGLLLNALRPVVESTRIISTTYHQLDPREIVELATRAHESASQLYQKLESWLPVTERSR